MLTEIKNISPIPLLLEEKFCVSITDRHGIITYVNPLFCELSKYSKEELVGQSYGMLNPDYTAESFVREMEYELTENTVWQRQIKSYAKDGSPYWVQATIVPVHDDEGEISQFLSFDIDVTSKIQTNEKYEKTLETLRNIENALDQSSVVVITDQQGTITYVNEKFCDLSRYAEEELIGQTHRVVNSGFHPKQFFKDMWQTIGQGGIWNGDIKNRAKDGSEYWVNTTIVPFLNKTGKPYQYISIRTDITARKQTEQSLEIALKNDFRKTVKNLQNLIFTYTYDEDNEIIFTLIEGKMAEKVGITENLVALHQLRDAFEQGEFSKLEHFFRQSMQGDAVQFELKHSTNTYLLYLSPIFENREVVEVVGTATDITQRKETEKLVEHMAYYDYLTELPNRRLFQMKAIEAIELAGRKKEPFALLFIDLDRFKNINDTMGHAIGDQLLKVVGQRLKNCIRKEDFVARLGGDEFVILLASTQHHEVEAIATRILEDISRSFQFGNHDVYVTPSIGISNFPEDGQDYDTLMTKADSAMYLAKENGKNTYQFFTQEMHREMIEKTTLERELRYALPSNQLTLHYQPQIEMDSGELIGLEALIRWQHPVKGLISPAHFIPIAEESGLIIPLGQWVLETACAQAKRWQSAGLPHVQIGVNVSLSQFKQATFVKMVKETLAASGLAAKYLNLEITESMTTDLQSCLSTLQQLREIGINVSIDDFGTGYSSFSYLSNLPLTHLKIDGAFIQDLNRTNRAIVKTIIALAKNLDLTVIAEGVETEEQVRLLRHLQCDEAQGYFYSKPLTQEQVENLLRQATYNTVCR